MHSKYTKTSSITFGCIIQVVDKFSVFIAKEMITQY